MGRYSRILGLSAILILFNSCCLIFDDCEECFEDPNLIFPISVSNILITQSFQPTFIGQAFYPNGTNVGVGSAGATNEFFAVTKLVPNNVTGGTDFVRYFWNAENPPAFQTPLNDGEFITFYKAVFNGRLDISDDCKFETAREISSILELTIRTNDNMMEIGRQTIEQTVTEIPAGQYGIFSYRFQYKDCGNYEFDITLNDNGQLSDVQTTNENFNEVKPNFGCN